MTGKRDYWNRCDACGRFIAVNEIGLTASRILLNPDAEGVPEVWETLCPDHCTQPGTGHMEMPI